MVDTGSWAGASLIFQKVGLRSSMPFFTIASVSALILSLSFESYAQKSYRAEQNDLLVELQRVLIESDDSGERAEAARALGQLGSGKPVKTLLRSLSDSNDEVREQAILALGQLRSRDAVSPIIVLFQSSEAQRLRSASAFALGLIGDRRAVNPLVAELERSDEVSRKNIIVALGLLGDPRAVKPLLSIPHDEEHKGCAPIAIALGQIKRGVPSDKLFDWLNGPEGDICPNAAIALVLVGGKSQVNPLIQVLNSENAISRQSAAFALGTLKDKRAVLPLIVLLNDVDLKVRLATIAALKLIRDKQAVEPLENIVRSDIDPGARERAAEAIKAILATGNEAAANSYLPISDLPLS